MIRIRLSPNDGDYVNEVEIETNKTRIILSVYKKEELKNFLSLILSEFVGKDFDQKECFEVCKDKEKLVLEEIRRLLQ